MFIGGHSEGHWTVKGGGGGVRFIVVTMSKTCESQCSILVVTINNMF